MAPVKYGLFFVALAVAVAVGDALLRSSGRRRALLTWPAVAFLVYGAAALLLRQPTPWWPALLAAPVLCLPVAAAVSVLRTARGRAFDRVTARRRRLPLLRRGIYRDTIRTGSP